MVREHETCRRISNQHTVHTYIHQLQLSIDHALAISYRRSNHGGKAIFVAHITLVKGVPFYGFHVGYAFFLKIYLLNPLNMTRLADLLRQGAIMKHPIQPYESHMQYLAQWMCDYSLYGCAFVDCQRVRYRHSGLDDEPPASQDDCPPQADGLVSDILNRDDFPKQSHCALEVDVRVEDIINRANVKPRNIHHDFIELQRPISADEKLVQSMAGLWRDETTRRQKRMGIIDATSSPFPAEVLLSVSAEPRNAQVGGWIHEHEYRERVNEIMKSERAKSDGRRVDFNGFVDKVSFESHIHTALESVEDLYEQNLRRVQQARQHTQRLGRESRHISIGAPQVDESRLFSALDDAQSDYDENELMVSHNLVANDHCKASGDKDTEPPLRNEPQESRLEHLSAAQGLQNPMLSGQPIEPAVRIVKPFMLKQLPAAGVHRTNQSLQTNDAFEFPEDFVADVDDEHTTSNKDDGSKREPKKRKIDHSYDNNVKASRQASSEQNGNSTDSLSSHALLGVNTARMEDMANGTSGNSFQNGSINDDNHKRSTKPDPFATQRNVLVDGKLLYPVGKPIKGSAYNGTELPGKGLSIKTVTGARPTLPQHSSFRGGDEHSSLATRDTRSQRIFQSPTPILLQCIEQIPSIFENTGSGAWKLFTSSPITPAELRHDFSVSNLPTMIYQDPFYSTEHDVPERPREYAGREYRLGSHTCSYLPAFDASGLSSAAGEIPTLVLDKYREDLAFSRRRNACDLRVWEFSKAPPTSADIRQWVTQFSEAGSIIKHLTDSKRAPGTKTEVSQIGCATQKNKYGFKYSQKRKSTSVQHETQYMSMMSVEIHVNTRGTFLPDPEHDEVSGIFWSLKGDGHDENLSADAEELYTGAILLCEDDILAQQLKKQTNINVEFENSELDTLTRLVDIVRQQDPDILTGYEVHGSSWGYLIERARCKYDFNLCDEFSRVASNSHGRFGKEADRWGFNHTSTIRVTGRHMINIWRAMRGELNLLQYTMENVVFQLCHRRIPHYSFLDLTTWYRSAKPRDMAKVLIHYITRVRLDLEILEQNELVPRTSEQARLLGVDFFSVFSRGSQFKVESLMFRISKPENLLLPSPSRKQVGQQNALECLPLVMEPQSAFFPSPVLVLDFQSLYPSVMIAYNYCYSTCLGRVVNWRGQNKMGFTDYHRAPRLLELLSDHINVAPNGILYAGPGIRKSLLAKMLSEILETRVMVKSGMKTDKEDKTLQRLLNNRQLALKLIANVTYGYTSASFSGRMPCSEIADSIVQTGREILEKAIALIHSVEKWGAEVVYGDTDSLFVHLKGRTKDEAFEIGRDISETVTKLNPRPIKLKFEKVYHPCVLLAKKRYVGFKYESKDQKEADFDAKGIETIRRDGTPAEQKIEEKAIKILFKTADLSQVKNYFQNQCEKIMRGKVSIQDFCFAKEVKLGTYSDKGPPPPGALISTKKMLLDPRAEPQYGERVPYVVIAGGPGARLIDRCVAPETVLQDVNLELDAEYYIGKNIVPPLERIFNLVGANVRQWFDEMPKFQRVRRVDVPFNSDSKDQGVLKKTLESYMKSSLCLVCRQRLEEETGLCDKCAVNIDKSLLVTQARVKKDEQQVASLAQTCRSCAGISWGEDVQCDSRDCPVFYTRTRQMSRLKRTKAMDLTVRQKIRGTDAIQHVW